MALLQSSPSDVFFRGAAAERMPQSKFLRDLQSSLQSLLTQKDITLIIDDGRIEDVAQFCDRSPFKRLLEGLIVRAARGNDGGVIYLSFRTSKPSLQGVEAIIVTIIDTASQPFDAHEDAPHILRLDEAARLVDEMGGRMETTYKSGLGTSHSVWLPTARH